MNLGAFVAQVWLEVKPIKRWKAKRAAKRAAKHHEAAEAVNGEYFNEAQEGGMEPKLRTSTKAVVGGTFLAQVYVQLVGLLPYEGLVAALTTPEAIALVSVLLAGVVARFSRTATKPGIL